MPDPVTRRRLLHLAGGLGLATAVSACATAPPAPTVQAGTPTTAPPAVQLADTPTAPAPIVTSKDMLCRDAWGAVPTLPGGRPHTITQMTLHHTAVVLGDNSNAPGWLRQHQRFHQGERGWIDIAYHVGVDRNGNIYELRTPELAGDTATEYDPAGHFLVLCEGDFDQEQPTEAQLDSAVTAFAWAAQQFNVGANTLHGHRDFAATSCPGANLYARLATGELTARVDALLNAGRVDLHKVCGPAASATVAAIESGA